MSRLAGAWAAASHVRPLPRIVLRGDTPEARWRALVAADGVDVPAILAAARAFTRDLAAAVLGLAAGGAAVGVIVALLVACFGVLARFSQYRRELAAIAAAVPATTVGELFLLNCVYELTACTAVVVADGSDAVRRPLLGRTLDWPMPALAGLGAVAVHQTADGRTLHESATWPGLVGDLTVVRPRAFAIAVNARYPSAAEAPAWLRALVRLGMCRRDPSSLLLATAVWRRVASALSFRAWCVPTLVRHVAETCATYDDAVAALCDAPVIADAYVTVCGVRGGEGCVITKRSGAVARWWSEARGGGAADASASAQLAAVGWSVRALGAGATALVQTNCDVSAAEAAALCGGVAPGEAALDDDMDSWTRLAVACAAFGGGGGATPERVGTLLMSSLSRARGVRVTMTVQACVMRPWAAANDGGDGDWLSAVRPTRVLGPRTTLPMLGGGRHASADTAASEAGAAAAGVPAELSSDGGGSAASAAAAAVGGGVAPRARPRLRRQRAGSGV